MKSQQQQQQQQQLQPARHRKGCNMLQQHNLVSINVSCEPL
jgi:hypothetical protein